MSEWEISNSLIKCKAIIIFPTLCVFLIDFSIVIVIPFEYNGVYSRKCMSYRWSSSVHIILEFMTYTLLCVCVCVRYYFVWLHLYKFNENVADRYVSLFHPVAILDSFSLPLSLFSFFSIFYTVYQYRLCSITYKLLWQMYHHAGVRPL